MHWEPDIHLLLHTHKSEKYPLFPLHCFCCMLLIVKAYLQPANQYRVGHKHLIHLHRVPDLHHKNARCCCKKLPDRNVPHIFYHENLFFLFEILCSSKAASSQLIADCKNPSGVSKYHPSLQWRYNPVY